MIVEPDAGLDVGRPRAIEIEGEGDLGLAGRPAHADPATVPSDDVEGSKGVRHGADPPAARTTSISCAAAISRSLPARSRIVRRNAWASGCPAPNVRGTRPRWSRPVATSAARSALAKSTRRKLVTVGPTDQPTS